MSKLFTIFNVFRRGAVVSDPTTWKQRQVAINAVFGLVSALAILATQMGWIPHEIATETVQQFSEGLVIAVLAIINILGTWATSRKVGPGPKPPMPEPSDAELWEDRDPGMYSAPAGVVVGQSPRVRSNADVGRETWIGD